jgi:hypothetical protein
MMFSILMSAALSIYSVKMGLVDSNLMLILSWLGAGFGGKSIQSFSENKKGDV